MNRLPRMYPYQTLRTSAAAQSYVVHPTEPDLVAWHAASVPFAGRQTSRSARRRRMGDDLMLEVLATACSGLFAGAAVYISAVQHPATLQTGATIAASFFPAMYQRAAPVQAGLAAVGTGAALLAWLGGSGILWLLGALLLGFVLPFTILAIKPVNDQLLAANLDPAAPETGELLRRWGVLHSVRSASSAIAFLLFLLA